MDSALVSRRINGRPPLRFGLFLTLLCCGCGGGEAEVAQDSVSLLPLEDGAEVIPVRGDPANATYYLLRMETMENGHQEVLTRRDGSSGTSYARREIDCNGAWSFRYLGEGETLAEAEVNHPQLDPLSELVPGSISSEISGHVCLSVRP